MFDETQICLACQDDVDPSDMGSNGVCWDCETYGHENGRGEVEQVPVCPDCLTEIQYEGAVCHSCILFGGPDSHW